MVITAPLGAVRGTGGAGRGGGAGGGDNDDDIDDLFGRRGDGSRRTRPPNPYLQGGRHPGGEDAAGEEARKATRRHEDYRKWAPVDVNDPEAFEAVLLEDPERLLTSSIVPVSMESGVDVGSVFSLLQVMHRVGSLEQIEVRTRGT